MFRRSFRAALALLPTLALVVLATIAAPSHAQARAYFGFGFNFAPAFYPPAYYYGPRVVYVDPPQVVYAPPVSVAPTTQRCEPYSKTILVNGQPREAQGTVCLQPDGNWRIVQ